MAKRKAGETEFVHELEQPKTKVQNKKNMTQRVLFDIYSLIFAYFEFVNFR